jgi:SAM-dependent methyltransferase
MELVACDLCGGNEYQVLASRMTGSRRTAICRQCGLVFTNPRWDPPEIRRIYAEEFTSDPGAPAREELVEGSVAEAEKERALARAIALPLASRFVDPRGKRWLEVRFRTGAMLGELHGLGAEVHGVDLFERSVNWVQERLPTAKLHVAPVHDLLGSVSDGFDVVSMTTIHVAAHVPSPTRLLEDVFDRLVPGGLLLLGEKDITRIPRLVPQFPLSERSGMAHYHHLTAPAMRAFVEKVGFEIVHADYLARASALQHYVIVARRMKTPRRPDPSLIRANDPQGLHRRLRWLFLRSRYRKVRYRAVVRAQRVLAAVKAAR